MLDSIEFEIELYVCLHLVSLIRHRVAHRFDVAVPRVHIFIKIEKTWE